MPRMRTSPCRSSPKFDYNAQEILEKRVKKGHTATQYSSCKMCRGPYPEGVWTEKAAPYLAGPLPGWRLIGRTVSVPISR